MTMILYDPWLLNLDVKATVGQEARCRCPVHSPDRKPSASFNMEKGLLYCYTCGASLSATQIAKLTGGVAMKMPDYKHVHHNEKEDWSWMFQMAPAYDNEYLYGRGVTNEEVKKYGIIETGLGVAFPITSQTGQVIGFQERLYTGEPKYILHGDRAPVWRMHLRSYLGKEPYVVEGVFGVINAERHGIKAVTCLSAGQIVHVRPYLSWMKPIVAFDDDMPGYVAAAKAMIAFGYRAVVPGVEADEIGGNEWKTLRSFRTITHRVGLLREASGDAAEFDHRIEKFMRRREYATRWS